MCSRYHVHCHLNTDYTHLDSVKHPHIQPRHMWRLTLSHFDLRSLYLILYLILFWCSVSFCLMLLLLNFSLMITLMPFLVVNLDLSGCFNKVYLNLYLSTRPFKCNKTVGWGWFFFMKEHMSCILGIYDWLVPKQHIIFLKQSAYLSPNTLMGNKKKWKETRPKPK